MVKTVLIVYFLGLCTCLAGTVPLRYISGLSSLKYDVQCKFVFRSPSKTSRGHMCECMTLGWIHSAMLGSKALGLRMCYIPRVKYKG